jgi:hypothetical protein
MRVSDWAVADEMKVTEMSATAIASLEIMTGLLYRMLEQDANARILRAMEMSSGLRA